jgi:DNA-binding MarR family transcriptional regulator
MTKARLNTVIHAPNRLQICAFLIPLQEAEFQVLRDELDVSDSVLSKHLKQLEEAGYVTFRKGAVNGRQRMWASLTKAGRKAFSAHVEELTRIAGVVATPVN